MSGLPGRERLFSLSVNVVNEKYPMITKIKTVVAALVATGILFYSLPVSAAEAKDAKAKPYPLKTCIVSDEEIGGDHGDPFIFVHEGQEYKLCCKPCQKDFDKNPKKYTKKLAKLAAKQEKDAQKAGKTKEPKKS